MTMRWITRTGRADDGGGAPSGRRWGCGVDGCGRSRGYLCPDCADARAEDQRLRKYGITAEDYAQQLRAQREQCAICRQGFGWTRPQIDHDHRMGYNADAVRGLLCGACNRHVVGGLERGATVFEAVRRALQAAEYLAQPIRPRVEAIPSGPQIELQAALDALELVRGWLDRAEAALGEFAAEEPHIEGLLGPNDEGYAAAVWDWTQRRPKER